MGGSVFCVAYDSLQVSYSLLISTRRKKHTKVFVYYTPVKKRTQDPSLRHGAVMSFSSFRGLGGHGNSYKEK